MDQPARRRMSQFVGARVEQAIHTHADPGFSDRCAAATLLRPGRVAHEGVERL